MIVELTYSERTALLKLIHSYMEDGARQQVFYDHSVVPPAEVSSGDLLTKIEKTVGGRKKRRA